MIIKLYWIPASPVKYEANFTGQAAGMTIQEEKSRNFVFFFYAVKYFLFK